MVYATGRTYHDADSHIMELPDFLIDHADPGLRGRMPKIPVPDGRTRRQPARRRRRARRHSAEKVAELVGMGDQLIAGPKGYLALGAFNTDERSQALDLLGFHQQLVFATFSAGRGVRRASARSRSATPPRAHNRAMAEFCGADPRLLGVALLPLDDPTLALAELERIIELGLSAVWVPHRAAGGRSPGHTDLDPVWAQHGRGGHAVRAPRRRLAAADRPDVDEHRPPGADGLARRRRERARQGHDQPPPAGGDVHRPMVLDGVFERHRGLRGGVIELGAGWVPQMLTPARLGGRDLAQVRAGAGRADPHARPSRSSSTWRSRRSCTRTSGMLIRQSDERLYLFSSDYPHNEGGRQPLSRFESSLDALDAIGLGESARRHFYAENFARLFPIV